MRREPVLLASVATVLGVALACQQPVGQVLAPAAPVERVEPAAPELFALHCAPCHGPEGRADGEASPFLFPPARDFSRGRFRLVSTRNGVPTDADLARVLERGMPGSAMPAWGHLEHDELAALARHVRSLAVAGMAERLVDQAREEDEPLTFARAREIARERMQPGAALPVPPPSDGPPSEAELARGEDVYARSCAGCHGEDGTGRGEPLWTEEGELSWVRDLTAGYLKGGASRAALAHRIGAGLPGSAMPPTRLAPDELDALVTFVRSLVPDGTERRFVHRPVQVVARRVPAPLPLEPGDPAWSWAREEQVVLAPLAWRDESILYGVVGAVHDGETIAIRVRWPDVTGETKLFSDTHEADAVALQFSAADAPPLFGMGSPEQPTNIWHWKSVRLSDVAGALDLLEATPHVIEPSRLEEVALDVPVYRRLEGVPALSRRGDALQASGLDSVADARADHGEVQVAPSWSDGEWSVVFWRTLEPGAERDVVLEPGTSVRFACAIWNGAAGDRGPQKSISIWHELAIED